MSSDRNKPCPICGSGKKYKKCCWGKKKVTHAVTFVPKEDGQITGVMLNFSTGEVKIMNGDEVITPASAAFTSSRERDKAPKALVKVPQQTDALTFNEFQSLTQKDAIFCIDTNTNEIDGRQVSVSCVIECHTLPRADGGQFVWNGTRMFELHNVQGKTENLAWHLLINSVQSSPDYDPGKQYTIITDSDAGMHASYNQRTANYYADFALPENFTLMYASDSGGELCNKAMKECHKRANLRTEELKVNHQLLALAFPSDSPYCSHFSNLYIESQHPTISWFELGRLENILLRPDNPYFKNR